MIAWAPARGARAAIVFLTRVPIGGGPYSDDEWRWSAAHFPLVGAALGALTAAADRLLLPVGDLAAAIGAVGVSMLLTGAFHEDGLADTADALGGGYDREKVLAILKDSRIGAFGACALVVSILGRAALIERLGPGAAWALPLVGAIARVGPVWQAVTMPYATSATVARSAAVAAAGPVQATVATAWALALAAIVVVAGHVPCARVAAIAAAVATVTVITAWRYKARVGGVTGDFLGATEQLCELVALGALAWA
jgi:adenosylcobinamide-GDP ribazoletransferase